MELFSSQKSRVPSLYLSTRYLECARRLGTGFSMTPYLPPSEARSSWSLYLFGPGAWRPRVSLYLSI